MEARIIQDRQQWNDFVAASKCCNITQSYEWGVLAPHLGAEALYAGVVDDEGSQRISSPQRHRDAQSSVPLCLCGESSFRSAE